MKLNPKAAALSAGALGAIFYLGCYLLVVFAPNMYRMMAQSWAHGVDMTLIWRPRTGNMGIGMLTFTGVSTLTGWGFAVLYNAFAGKK